VTGARVLVVDDEPQIRYGLRRSLEAHGYAVREAVDAADAMRQFSSFRPDVVLLDLMLPDGSGVDVCRDLRLAHATPVIVLSALGDEQTKIDALDTGADDYLTKPFATGELLARVRAALRRAARHDGDAGPIIAGDLAVDLERRVVTKASADVRLTPTEYSLLRYLASNAGKVLTHAMILREVWGPEYATSTHVLRTYVNQLRAKVEDDPAHPVIIRTDPGVGYRFVQAERAAEAG
jgi:two-component system KDP operon response regulator KdpE